MSDPFASFDGLYAPVQPQPSNPFAAQPQQQQPPNDNPFDTAYGMSSSSNYTSSADFSQQHQHQAYMQNQQQQTLVATNSAQPTNQWAMQHESQSPSNYNSMQMNRDYQQQQHLRPGTYINQMTPQPSQQTLLVPSSTQSMATNYMTPAGIPYSGSETPQTVATSMMMTPIGQTQLFSPDQGSIQQQPQQQQQQQQQQNGYDNPFGQQNQQHQQQASSLPPQSPAPAPPAINTTTDEDDDFFGSFSTAKAKENKHSPTPAGGPSSLHRPPSEFEADYEHHENVSVLSKSTGGGTTITHRTNSALDDPRFAPKPPKPAGLDNAKALARTIPPGSASPLPNFELVTHSGYVQARISFRTILIKKWKQVFWVTYGLKKLLVFRSSADFEDWVSNPYLNKAQRDFLVKLEIDLVEDLSKPNVRGYQVTNQRLKNYNNQMLYQFKIERWMDYGPTIAAAFGSPNEREIFQLRTVFSEMLKRSPSYHNHNVAQQLPSQNSQRGAVVGLVGRLGGSQSSQRSQRSQHSYTGVRGHNNGALGPASYNYSSNASTGMIYEQGSVRSSRSYGVASTGPLERHTIRDSSREAVAGYYPTSSTRNGFQY